MSLLVSLLCKNKVGFRVDRTIRILSTHPNFTNVPSSSSAGQPSLKTSVILKDIGTSADIESLKTLLADIKYRKVEVQPGCSLHVMSEVEADYVRQKINKELSLESSIVKTSSPTVIVKNLPDNTTISSLYEKFGSYKPNKISKLGSTIFQTVFLSASDALQASRIVAAMSIEGATLHTATLKLPDGRYLLQIHDVPESMDVDKASQLISSTLESSFAHQRVQASLGAPKNLVLRITPKCGVDRLEMKNTIDKIASAELAGVVATSNIGMKKPAIFVRKVSHCKEGTVEKVLKELGAVKVQAVTRGNEVMPPDLAVAYFESEEVALAALRKLKSVTLDGGRITVTYKETSEPTVELSNLPGGCEEKDIEVLLQSVFVKPVSIHMLPSPANPDSDGNGAKSKSTKKAIITLSDPREAVQATDAFRKAVLLRGKRIAATLADTDDISLTISSSNLQSGAIQQVILAIKQSDLVDKVQESKWVSNVSATISFTSLNEANSVHADIASGKIDTGSEDVVSKVVALPSFAIEVCGFPQTKPSQELVDLSTADNLVKLIGTSRTALLKFRKHSDVLPEMIKVGKCVVDGKRIKAIRYSPLELAGSSEYDTVGRDEEWDQFSLQSVLKDYMFADPATRWQVAHNQFERAFKDAQLQDSIDGLLDESTPPAIMEEMRKIILDPEPDTARAFELFVQRQDMLKFSFDFNEMQSLLGRADPSDPFNWSQFNIEDVESVNKLEEAMDDELKVMQAQEKHVRAGAGVAVTGGRFEKAAKDAGRKMVADNPDGDDEDEADPEYDEFGDPKSHGVEEDALTVRDEDDNEKVIDLTNVDMLTDKDGQVWSGVILDTDTVQTTLPGGRLMSFRALVVVGNLKGAAGFGVAKGENVNEAISAAFRDALRNLLYIDLYDNFGLAHDVHGKHNSCHAYIRATPETRLMKASHFASAILKRFGIASASCKLVGRRNPYSMVRAIFNGLEKHENIDEFAKARGQRYLTLRWAYAKNI